VLDCACGSGYGTEILATMAKAKPVIGVDRSAEAIHYAQTNHLHPNVTYAQRELGLMDRRYQWFHAIDVVVTLETLEHLPGPECRAFLTAAARWISPGGLLIASSPMLRYRDGQPYITSPYHINEMPRAELLALFEELLSAAGWVKHYYHQEQESFLPLLDEHTGFCILVARKR
jgi:2-polyprenyl-3-methyl-5-hydroxy-6-metoxy-1,4-benzoquinol methylase